MSTKGYGHPDNYMGKSVADYPLYFNRLAQDLPKNMDVLDLFGGVGLLAQKMWPVLEPRSWVCLEADVGLKDQLLEPRAKFVYGDAFTTLLRADLYIIDPDKCTLNKIWKEQRWANLLGRLAATKRPILMQEYGAYWCHLPNQKPLYEQLSGGTPVGRLNYPELFARKMADWFDIKIQKWSQGLGSTYYLMEGK